MSITASELVRREVYYCVSSLVSSLAMGCHAVSSNTGEGRQLLDLTEQAVELAAPVLDYEEAAREAGWQFENVHGNPMWTKGSDLDEDKAFEPSAEAACAHDDIEPYDREVYEHWLVSDWLADKLIEKGEKVDKDFAGMTIWARTTTGQAVACDHVIKQIAADLNADRD